MHIKEAAVDEINIIRIWKKCTSRLPHKRAYKLYQPCSSEIMSHEQFTNQISGNYGQMERVRIVILAVAIVCMLAMSQLFICVTVLALCESGKVIMSIRINLAPLNYLQ